MSGKKGMSVISEDMNFDKINFKNYSESYRANNLFEEEYYYQKVFNSKFSYKVTQRLLKDLTHSEHPQSDFPVLNYNTASISFDISLIIDEIFDQLSYPGKLIFTHMLVRYFRFDETIIPDKIKDYIQILNNNNLNRRYRLKEFLKGYKGFDREWNNALKLLNLKGDNR